MPKKPDREIKKTPKKPAAPRAGGRAKQPQAATEGSPKLPSFASLITELLAASRNPAAAIVPVKPLPAGTAGTEIPINLAMLQKLVLAAATLDNPGQQVWTDGSSDLLVLTGKVSVALDDGLLLLTIPVSCDQFANAAIQVPFALGGKKSPSGMVMATEKRPRGPDLIVDVWAEQLTAFAWHLVMAIVVKAAGQSGIDEDGASLIPISMTSTKEGLTLLPLARHTFDRVKS